MALTNTQLATELYVAYFGRAPDPVGLNVWVTALNAGVPFATVAADFANSTEAKTLYPFLTLTTAPDPGTAMGFVNAVYNNLLNRAPDAAGLAFWSGLLDTGQITVGNFILDVLQSINAQPSTTADSMTLANKVTVGDFYAVTVATLNAPFTEAQAVAAIAGVTSTAASVTAAEALITATVTVAHNTFTLTTGIDAFSTSAAGAVFNALPSQFVPLLGLGFPAMTLNTGDNLLDLNGDGTLNLTIPGGLAGAVLNPPYAFGVTMNGIKTANITNLSTTGATGGFSGVNVTGLTVVNDTNSIAPVVLGDGASQGLQTLLTNVNIKGYGGGNGNFVFQGIIAAAAASAAATLNVSVSGTMGNTVANGANILSFTNDNSTAGTLANPNLTAGTLALTVNSTSNLTLTGNGGGGDGTGGFSNFAIGTADVTGFTAITLAGAGNVALSTDFKGNFGDLKSINASTATGTVIITGASSGATGNSLATPANFDWLFGANAFGGFGGAPGVFGSGLLTGDAVFNSYTGTATSTNILDVSGLTLAQFSAGTFTGNTAAGIVNQLVVSNAVATTTLATTFATDTGWQQLDVTGIGGTINAANLPATVNDIFYMTPSTAAVVITHAASGLTVDTEAQAGGGALTVTSAAAAGATSTLSVVVGDATFAGAGILGTEVLGALTTTGETVLNISSVGGVGAGATNFIGLVSVTPTLTQNEVVNISGNTSVHIGVEGVGAIADFNPTSPTTLNFNNMVVNDTDTGVTTLAAATGGALFFAVPGDTAGGSGVGGNPLNGATNAEVINASTSGGLVMQGLDVNFTAGGTPLASVGDVITGSATGGNALAGSIGNDVITVANPGADTIATSGGGDTITLAAGSTAATYIEAYAPFDSGPAQYGTATGVLPGQEFIPRFASITDASDVPQLGWWGQGTGGAATGYTATGLYAGMAVNTGTSADASTVANWVATDVADFGASAGFLHGAIWNLGGANGLGAGGVAQGLINGGDTAVVAPGVAANTFLAATVQQAGATGTVIAAATNFIELTGNPFLTSGAVATALSTAAYNLILTTGIPTLDSAHILLGWQDTTGSAHIADVALANLTAATQTNTDLLDVHVSDIVVLTGVPLTSLTSAQIHFV